MFSRTVPWNNWGSYESVSVAYQRMVPRTCGIILMTDRTDGKVGQ